jgi:peptidoglycan/xylan/chitin deacetylase (PgdA/CDA1 family)
VARPTVLMYHAFGQRSADADPHNLFVPQEAFAWQVSEIARRGPLDLNGFLAARNGRGARGTLVTIDDGYVSTLDVAAPMLARAGVPAVLFLPPGRLGATSAWMPEMPDERLLAPDRLRELADHGIEVGAHGFDHTDMAGMTPEELRRHTVEAATALADHTGRRPRSFAYPRGVHDAAARAAVEAAGYEVAFSVYDARGGRWAVPRADVNALDTRRTFRLKCVPWFPAAKHALDHAPAVRRLLHRGVGTARR